MKFRQVHLDFHTGEAIDSIGDGFDKKQFQEMLKLGHVNSITVFSKCHHGWSYHPTETNQMHPGLRFDLLKAQIEACHEIGVKAPGYISAGYDEKYVRQHPEDLCRRPDGSPLRGANLAGYHQLCLNSPYVKILAEQVKEMCRNYDVDGVFLDIVRPRPCYCHHCVNEMRARGLDPYDEATALQFGEEVFARYTETMRAAVDSVKPGLPIYHNGGTTPPGRRDWEYRSSHSEIESLPTGGWGYDDLPFTARNIQSHDGRSYLGMTGKFHLTWGEFGGFKHPNALIYETALAVANGAKCSVGDQLHPSGVMDPETYRIIGEAYKRIEEREPWLEDVTPVADIGLLSCQAWLRAHPEVDFSDAKSSDIGALRVLLEGHYLFDVLDLEDDFSPYKVIVLPDGIRIDGDLKEKLDAFVSAGGKLLASGLSGLDSQDFAYDFGVKYEGEESVEPVYLSLTEPMGACGVADYVLYAPSQRVSLTDGGNALADQKLPYFVRTPEHFCSHSHAPQAPDVAGVGMAEGKNGIYIANRIFYEYASIGPQIAKQAVLFALDRLLPEKTVAVDLPGQGIVTLMDQPSEGRSVLHLLYAPRTVKGTKKIEVIEDCVPLCDVPVTLRTRRPVRKVYLAPSGEALDVTVTNGAVRFTVPKIEIHAMAVVEYQE